MTKKSFLRAFRDSLPIMAGYLALGIGYGVLLQSKGPASATACSRAIRR